MCCYEYDHVWGRFCREEVLGLSEIRPRGRVGSILKANSEYQKVLKNIKEVK